MKKKNVHNQWMKMFEIIWNTTAGDSWESKILSGPVLFANNSKNADCNDCEYL